MDWVEQRDSKIRNAMERYTNRRGHYEAREVCRSLGFAPEGTKEAHTWASRFHTAFSVGKASR
jgi:hypothetical protein